LFCSTFLWWSNK